MKKLLFSIAISLLFAGNAYAEATVLPLGSKLKVPHEGLMLEYRLPPETHFLLTETDFDKVLLLREEHKFLKERVNICETAGCKKDTSVIDSIGWPTVITAVISIVGTTALVVSIYEATKSNRAQDQELHPRLQTYN